MLMQRRIFVCILSKSESKSMRLAESTEILYNLASGGVVMARDMAKKAAADLKSQQKVYKQVTMKIRKDSGIYEALQECEKQTGVAPATYAQLAVVEKLRRDGFLQKAEK